MWLTVCKHKVPKYGCVWSNSGKQWKGKLHRQGKRRYIKSGRSRFMDYCVKPSLHDRRVAVVTSAVERFSGCADFHWVPVCVLCRNTFCRYMDGLQCKLRVRLRLRQRKKETDNKTWFNTPCRCAFTTSIKGETFLQAHRSWSVKPAMKACQKLYSPNQTRLNDMIYSGIKQNLIILHEKLEI